jgi:hypothetical protein
MSSEDGKKVQFYRKNEYVDVMCPMRPDSPCTWNCINVPEPSSDNGVTYVTFNCGAYGVQLGVPDASFEDER